MKYYHGTSDIIKIKDEIIKPPVIIGFLKESWREKNLNKVYFTDSLLSAEKFAYKACKIYGGCGIIYSVEPIGDIIHSNTNEYIADKAKILKVISRYDKNYKQWLIYDEDFTQWILN